MTPEDVDYAPGQLVSREQKVAQNVGSFMSNGFSWGVIDHCKMNLGANLSIGGSLEEILWVSTQFIYFNVNLKIHKDYLEICDSNMLGNICLSGTFCLNFCNQLGYFTQGRERGRLANAPTNGFNCLKIQLQRKELFSHEKIYKYIFLANRSLISLFT